MVKYIQITSGAGESSLKLKITVLCLLVLFTGCTRMSVEVSAPPLIALSIENRDSSLCIGIINEMSRFAADSGYQFIFEGSENSLKGQIRGITTLLERDPDFLIISPVTSLGLEDQIDQSHKRGVGTILMNSTTRVHNTGSLSSIIACDHVKEGALVSEAFSTLSMGESTQILEIQGPILSSVTRDLALGFRQGLGLYENLYIAAVIENCGTRIEAYSDMREALEKYGSSIDAIFAHNDRLGLGVQDALLEVGYKIPIISIGGSTDAAKAILSTSYYGTVYREDGISPLFSMIRKHIENKSDFDSIVLKSTFISAENARDLIP
ncbi:substrate-binding domain-containing protein [Oceanispirochaeta sp.]|jgi:ABC-type sugar transport system substrate-binding protein|uniref:substrate-binding domain-containing protein n=1 Tax=Oceanispirochaeta sp. TaxID=2035350 RepID=UPI002636DA12|nr:substrate-binding domain-containing protein [Oceanispirochaeta sp.]MDA3955147.1 substrate-binding domain-containing protein [Oceanispirochaeta sp.]